MSKFNVRNGVALTAAVAIAAGFAVPASASGAAQANAPRDAGASAPRQRNDERAGERRICVRDTLSGSRMPRRICKTEREWQAEAGQAD